MQKKYLPKITNICLILLFCLTFCLVGIFYQKDKGLLSEEDISNFSTELTMGENFQAKLVNSTIQQMQDGKFSYKSNDVDQRPAINETGTSIVRDSTIMLHNYGKTIGQSAENIYLFFGNKYDSKAQLEGNQVTEIKTVNLYINNEYVDNLPFGIVSNKDANGNPITLDEKTSNYFYCYFDLNSDNLPQGTYSIGFTYNLYNYNEEQRQYVVSNNLTYRFDFTLINQTVYAMSYSGHNNFPDLINPKKYVQSTSGEYSYEKQSLLKYYYNYTLAEIPTVEYDAENYNLTYTHRTNTGTDTYTTHTTKSGSVITLHTLKNGIEVDNTILTATDGHYLHTISFDNQGVYTFVVRYQLQQNESEYLILDEMPVDNYQFDAVHPSNNVQADTFTLSVFGAKATFNKNGVNTELYYKYNDDIIFDADYTSRLAEEQSINSYESLIISESNTTKLKENFDSEESINIIPITNMGPVRFDYFGILAYTDDVYPVSEYTRYNTFSDLKNDENGTTIKLQKETSINEEGYYDVTIAYTSDDAHNSETTFYQRFIFAITSGEPEVTINTIDESENKTAIGDQKYTNKDISFTITPRKEYDNEVINEANQNYFCYPVSSTYQVKAFDGSLYGNEIIINEDTKLSEEGHYLVKVNYGKNSYSSYEFTIDKTNPNSPNSFLVQAITKSQNDPTIVGFIKNENLTINNHVTNDWFGLDYDKVKPSGANVSVTWQKYSFDKDTTFIQDGEYIANGYILKQLNTENNPYSLEITTQGTYQLSSILKPTDPAIYLFTLTDEAGNFTQYAILFDNTKPNVIVDPEPSNQYNVVNSDTTITWGKYKAFQISNTIGEETITTLSTLLNTKLPTVEVETQTRYLLPIELTEVQLEVSKVGNLSNYTYRPSTLKSLSLKTDENATDTSTATFGGEAIYHLTILDKSMVSHVDTSLNYTIEMNLDQSLGMVFIGDNEPANRVQDLHQNNISNAKQLYFTYLAGDEGTQFFLNEEDVTYTYYPFDTTAYAGKNNSTALDAMIAYIESLNTLKESEGITDTVLSSIKPGYPFTTPTQNNVVVKRSDYILNGDENRIVSVPINTSSEDNKNTQEGMYVFRREYKSSLFDASATTDTKVRYYVMLIDRSNILNIDSNTIIINPDGSKDHKLEYYFNTGSGIQTTVGNGDSKYTMDALDIQNYLNNPMATPIHFQTNKLPVIIQFPTEKYNTYQAFQKWIELNGTELTTSQQAYLAKWYDNEKFKFQTTNALQITKNLGIGFTNVDIPLTLSDDGYTYTSRCIEEGQYTLKLLDKAGNVQEIIFEIKYDAPTGNFRGKNNSTLATGTDSYHYRASNTEQLYFEFNTYLEPLQANIDIQNIVVNQIVDGTTNTYVLQYNTDEHSTTVLKNNTPIISDNQEIIQAITNTYGTTYKITLLPETYDSTIIPFDPMVEATYEVTIQYEDFDTISDLTTTNWRQTYSITIDRTAPTLNRNALIDKDKYYGASAIYNDLSVLNTYFLAVKDTQEIIYHGGLENDKLYYRYIGSVLDGYPSDYSPTKTFSPNATDEDSNAIFTLVTEFTSSNNAPTIRDIFGTSYGYYELIETDEAGNYSVYPVYYFNNETSDYSTTPIFNLLYKEASNNSDIYSQATLSKDGLYLGATHQEDFTLAAKSLQFGNYNGTDAILENINYNDGVTSNDLWLKAIISYNDERVVVINNPATNINTTNPWENFVLELNRTINGLETSYVSYSFTITFVNRLDDNFTITYLTPTAELNLIIQDINANEFSVEIPVDTIVGGQTKIVKFEVYHFDERYKSKNSDSNGDLIMLVTGKKYYFRDGQYKFVYEDNFGRVNTVYYSAGVENYNELSFINSETKEAAPSKTLTIDEREDGSTNSVNITYVAYNAILEFSVDAYEYTLKVYDEENATYVDFNRSTLYKKVFDIKDNYTTTDGNRRRTIEVYMLPESNDLDIEWVNHVRFRAELTYAGDMETKMYHRFEITHELPKVQLLNYSGIIINNVSTDPLEPTQFSEDIFITWEESRFGQTILLTKNNSETIKITNNQHRISAEGLYKLAIENGLGYHSDTIGTTLYFRRTSNNIIMYEVVSIDENNKETTLINSPIHTTYVSDTGQKYPVYEYYKLENTRTDIRLNKNKNLVFSIVESESTEASTLYCIIGSSEDFGYIRYIRVNTVTASNQIVSNSLRIYDNDLLDGAGNPLELYYENQILCTSKNGLTLKWNHYHNYSETNHGNLILASYYYNSELVETIYNTTEDNTLSLKAAGYYQFIFKDLAGNVQQFNINGITYDYLFFYIVNDVLFTVNDSHIIPNQIFNSSVKITLTNRDLYARGVDIAVTKNGQPITVYNTGTGGKYIYQFMDHGYYEVTMKSYITQTTNATTDIKEIITVYRFTIINPNQALLGYNISSALNFQIRSLMKDNVDITNSLENREELWLSNMSYGNGRYTVNMTYYSEEYKRNLEFAFNIWINSEIPSLISSIDWGSDTTDVIIISFNINVIYQQIGDSYISITGMSPIHINSSTANNNQRTDVLINNVGENWISLYTADGNLVNSYKVVRNEPLNGMSIFLIVIGCIGAVVLVVIFIFLRRRIKVR